MDFLWLASFLFEIKEQNNQEELKDIKTKEQLH